MKRIGLYVACRYAYPPNSFSLCGPNRQTDLSWYTNSDTVDLGTREILSQFSTLYPYLKLIAGENKISDQFDSRVIDAYWIGNQLLETRSTHNFLNFLDDELLISKKNSFFNSRLTKQKVANGGLPHHAFHVLNIYNRTGNNAMPHSIETADACIIHWGKVVEIGNHTIHVMTNPLIFSNNRIRFGLPIKRKIYPQGDSDNVFKSLSIGDLVTYHWGYVCEKIKRNQMKSLQYYTLQAIHHANTFYEK